MSKTMKKKEAINFDDLCIQGSFTVDLNKGQQNVTIGPGEEKFIFPILQKRPTLLNKLIAQGKIRKKIYEVPIAGTTPGRYLEWFDDSFAQEFYLARPREEIIAVIRGGKNCKFLSPETLRRLKIWIFNQPQSGGVGAKIIISAIDSQLKALGEPVDEIQTGEHDFEAELARLQAENIENETEKPEQKEAVNEGNVAVHN